ncbi:MAG: hypothetical protein U9Q03_04830 [Patescibacteria group bacterium]|nr:hypothetical protein [Patescibacteria group bacterium]
MTRMNLGTPPELKGLLTERRRTERRKHKRSIIAREERLRRRADIDGLRVERFDELWKAAEFIFGWRDWAARDDTVQELFTDIGDKYRLVLFRGDFWQGVPKDKSDRAANARLLLAGNPSADGDGPSFIYEEYYNSSHGSSTHTSPGFNNIAELISGVHPDFLIQAYESLRGPDAWKFILQDLNPIR